MLHGPSRFALRVGAPPSGPPAAYRAGPVFVTFEGADGSGKSTQAELLRAALAEDGRDVVLTREPGGTELGEAVRALVLNGPVMGAWAEAALFAASRAEHVEEVIRPALERGADVLCDRYVDSSLAYQGIARGLGIDAVLQLNLAVTGGLLPDTTFLLLLDPDVATGRQVDPDRLEREGTELQAKVDAAYRVLAERFPEESSRSTPPESPRRSQGRYVSGFETVPEQHEAKRLLAAALQEGPAHAYLFHGPAGVGKRELARRFAAELLGEHARVERGTHPDLYVLEPLGEQIRIDDVRELRRDLHMRPFEAERRVYLVFGADSLNEDAADALLKDLEEPPPYAVVVLVAERLGPLPETIRSRCQLVPFRRLSEPAVRQAIREHAPARRGRADDARARPRTPRPCAPAPRSSGVPAAGDADRRRPGDLPRPGVRTGGGAESLLAGIAERGARRRRPPRSRSRPSS